MGNLTTWLPSCEVAESPPGSTRISRSVMRGCCRLVSRVQQDLVGMGFGWTSSDSRPGPHNAGELPLNFVQEMGFRIWNASGYYLTVILPGGADPRDVVTYQTRHELEGGGTALISHWGVAAMPGDRLNFGWPSSFYAKSFPVVQQIIAYDPQLQSLTLRLDQDVTNCRTSIAEDNVAPDFYTVHLWRYAGDPEKWTPILDPPHNRCTFCVRDYSDSVSVLYPSGVTIDSGKTWYCARQHWSTEQVDESTGDVTYTHHTPSGLSAFCAGCNQTGCSGYVALPLDAAEGTLTVRRGWARWLRDIHTGIDTKYSTVYAPGQPATWTKIQRLSHPSAMSLLGVCQLESRPQPIGYEASTGYPVWHGYNICGDMIPATIDANGHIYMRIRHGYDWDSSHENLSSVQYDNKTTWPEAGHAARNVTGWTSIRQQLAKGTPHNDSTDPTRQMRQCSPFSGVALMRDAGSSVGRGFQWDIRGNVSDPLDVMFEALPPTVINGVTYTARLVCPPLTENGKGELVIASRSIINTGTVTGQIWIDFAHERHVAEWQDNAVTPPEIRSVTWRAGGGAGFPLPSWARQISGNEADRSMGGAFAVMPGDCLVVGDRAFVVLQATPCGGEIDTDWDIQGPLPPGSTGPPSWTYAGLSSDYATWAGRRDRVVIADESGLLPLGAAEFRAGRGCWVPPATAQYSLDGLNWTPLVGGLYEHGNGYVWLTASQVVPGARWRLV